MKEIFITVAYFIMRLGPKQFGETKPAAIFYLNGLFRNPG